MKTLKFLAVCLVALLGLHSYGSNGNDVDFVKSITLTVDEDSEKYSFAYDDDKISKITFVDFEGEASEVTFSYPSETSVNVKANGREDVITMTENGISERSISYTKDGSTASATYSFADGYFVQETWSSTEVYGYAWSDGNLTTVTYDLETLLNSETDIEYSDIENNTNLDIYLWLYRDGQDLFGFIAQNQFIKNVSKNIPSLVKIDDDEPISIESTLDDKGRLSQLVYNGVTYTFEYVEKAYEVLDNGTLTFRYDDAKPDDAYELGSIPMMTAMKIKNVVFEESFSAYKPTSCAKWFEMMVALTEIQGLEYLNTEDVTDMSAMFSGCAKLTTIDLNGFNTQNVTNMNKMFSACAGLTSLDMGSFNTEKVADMGAMFSSCKNIETIFVGDNWTTDAVTSSDKMFSNCAKLCGGKGSTFVDLGTDDKTYAKIDGGVSNAGYFTKTGEPVYDGNKAYVIFEDGVLTFYYGENIPEGAYEMNSGTTPPQWSSHAGDVKKVVFDDSFKNYKPSTCASWFANCAELTDDNIIGMKENLNFEKVVNATSMFDNCKKLTHIDLSSFNTTNLQDMFGIFSMCDRLETVDLSSFDTKNVNNMGFLFAFCPKLRTVYVGDNWNTDAVTLDFAIFYKCMKLHGGQGTHFEDEDESDKIGKAYAQIDGGAENPGLFTKSGDPAFVFDEAYVVLQDGVMTFYYNKNKPENAKDIEDLIAYEKGTEWKSEVEKAVFDESFKNYEPKSCLAWFLDCSNMTEIVGMNEYLNTNKVTTMDMMFKSCTKLTSVDVSGFNTENVLIMSQMFAGCGFTNLDLKNFDTQKVYEMTGLFSDCKKLVSVDLSSFNTANVTNMPFMFTNCGSLTELDLSSFNTAKVESMYNMFTDCESLKTIYVGDDWSTESVIVSTDMFAGCINLVGDDGSSYDSQKTDASFITENLTKKPETETAICSVFNTTAVTIVNGQILVNGDAPAFVVTVSGQNIANANLKAGVYFVVADGKTVGVSVR